jgi:branched-subunit amino acid aminotransferase/4-amino-4-deoxychorismate lyase
MHSIGDVLIDGVAHPPGDATVSVFDVGMQRGYGCFEALRAYGGTPFRLGAHLDRLERSAARLYIDLPPRSDLDGWVRDRAAAGGDCVVRVFVTGGTDVTTPGLGSRVIVYAEPLGPRKAELRVTPVDAPWHPDGATSELTGAKTLSYGPNVAAALTARRHGFDDAMLIGREGAVLEGPTYSIAWVRGDHLETPALTLGILASITRTAALDLAPSVGLTVVEGEFPLDRVVTADEVMALSTLKEVMPVTAVGDHTLPVGPYTRALAHAFSHLVAGETG